MYAPRGALAIAVRKAVICDLSPTGARGAHANAVRSGGAAPEVREQPGAHRADDVAGGIIRRRRGRRWRNESARPKRRRRGDDGQVVRTLNGWHVDAIRPWGGVRAIAEVSRPAQAGGAGVVGLTVDLGKACTQRGVRRGGAHGRARSSGISVREPRTSGGRVPISGAPQPRPWCCMPSTRSARSPGSGHSSGGSCTAGRHTADCSVLRLNRCTPMRARCCRTCVCPNLG